MGSQASSEICDIASHNVESRILQTNSNVIKWLHYRDDMHLLHNGTHEEVLTRIAGLNKTHDHFKLTMEKSDTKVTF